MDSEPENHNLADAMEGDPSAAAEDYRDPALEDLASVPGLIGVRDIRDLADYATRIADIGRSAHNPFGDRVVVLAGRVSDIAREARRRIEQDRLPPDAGTDPQREWLARADDDIVPPA